MVHKALKVRRRMKARRKSGQSNRNWMSRRAGAISLREMPVAFTGYGLSAPHCGQDAC